MVTSSPWSLPAGIRPRPWAVAAAAAVAGIAVVGGGLLGSSRYLRNFWLYRGFDPPRDPAFVQALGDVGTTQRFYVDSPALGGRHQPVDVYLPPGYAERSRPVSRGK